MRNDYTDYIKHGLSLGKHKYVAKVKYGAGNKHRYFYNNDDYQAYLKQNKSNVTTPTKVDVNHKINQVRFRAQTAGSTLSNNVATLSKKAKHTMNDVSLNLHSAAHNLKNNASKTFKKASSSLKNSRVALDTKYNMTVLSNNVKKKVDKTFGHGEKNNKMSDLEKATMKAKRLVGKTAKKAWHDEGTKYSHYKKVAKEAKASYDENVAPKIKKAANNAKENYKYYIEPAIKKKASEVYNKATKGIKEDIATSKRETARAKKRANKWVAETMNEALANTGGMNGDYKKVLANAYRNKMAEIAKSSAMPEEKAMWQAQLIASAKKNGFAKYLLKKNKTSIDY